MKHRKARKDEGRLTVQASANGHRPPETTAMLSCEVCQAHELGKCFSGAVISVKRMKARSLPNLPFTSKTTGSQSILICYTESQDADALWLGFCIIVKSWGNEIPFREFCEG